MVSLVASYGLEPTWPQAIWSCLQFDWHICAAFWCTFIRDFAVYILVFFSVASLLAASKARELKTIYIDRASWVCHHGMLLQCSKWHISCAWTIVEGLHYGQVKVKYYVFVRVLSFFIFPSIFFRHLLRNYWTDSHDLKSGGKLSGHRCALAFPKSDVNIVEHRTLSSSCPSLERCVWCVVQINWNGRW